MVTDDARFWSKVDCRGDDECWPWQGEVKVNGYGRFRTYRGGQRNHYAHRWAFASHTGAAPDGLDVDHICHNASDCPGGWACPHRRCCNPHHLRAVSHRVNLAAGRKPKPNPPRRTHCKWGHAFTPQNTYVRRDGYRMCRKCNARRQRETKQRRAPKWHR